MNVGYVTTTLAPEDGWGRYSQSVAEAMLANANVRVLTQKEAVNPTTIQDVHAVLPRFGFHPRKQLQIFKSTYALLKDCDIIHVMVEPYAPGVALACLLRRIPFVMTLHGTYAVAPKKIWSIRRWMQTFALKRAAVTTSGSYNTEAKARESVTFGECRLIPNGADMSFFHVLPQRSVQQYFMTSGEVKPRKGQDICVEALGLLKDEFPDLRYKVAGDNKRTWFIDQMRNIAEKYGVSSRLDILGRVEEEELRMLYNNCQTYVLAARDDGKEFEGFPLVYFEAYSCGAPIITTIGFGSEYAVKDGETGYLIHMDNPQELADALRKILSDASEQQRLSNNAVHWAEQHTVERIAKEQILPMYEDAISQ